MLFSTIHHINAYLGIQFEKCGLFSGLRFLVRPEYDGNLLLSNQFVPSDDFW